MRHACDAANRAVYEQSQLSEDFTGMGTTLVAAFLSRDLAVIINVGDSRAYHFTRDDVSLVTRDHSMVAYMVERGELTQEQRQQLLRSTNEDAQWLIRIVENLLSITRIHNSEEARVKKAPEAAEEVIGSAVAKTQKHYPDVEVHVSVPHELMMVPMDPLLIEQVLVNLMENAVIHGGTSRIDVTLSQQGGNAVFTVADNGRGIPLHLLNKLFDGAARSDRSSDGKRSMGIGLSVCRTVVLAHGGTIRGENKKDGGACFTVTLPMKGDDDED